MKPYVNLSAVAREEVRHGKSFEALVAIEETDVVEYPDSQKVGFDIGTGVAEPPRSQYLRGGREVPYWDGED
jgi:hypothetical protein